MKTYGLILFATILTLTLGPAAIPQQGVPPASNQANASPSLAVTMQFIQDKLNGMGILRYTSYHSDPGYPPGPANAWSYTRSAQMSSVVGSPSTCIISYHEREDSRLVPNETIPDATPTVAEADYSIPLKDVQDLKVETMEQYITGDMAALYPGYTAIATATQPKTLMLIVQRSNGSPNHVAFQDAALADRVAKALVHAVALCGGGNKDPF